MINGILLMVFRHPNAQVPFADLLKIQPTHEKVFFCSWCMHPIPTPKRTAAARQCFFRGPKFQILLFTNSLSHALEKSTCREMFKDSAQRWLMPVPKFNSCFHWEYAKLESQKRKVVQWFNVKGFKATSFCIEELETAPGIFCWESQHGVSWMTWFGRSLGFWAPFCSIEGCR